MLTIDYFGPSTRRDKRFMVVFNDGTTTHFGDPTRDSYPFHQDRARKIRYMQRHQRDLETGDMRRAGFLSWYVLWGYPDLNQSLEAYRSLLHQVHGEGVHILPTDIESWMLPNYEELMNSIGVNPWVDVNK